MKKKAKPMDDHTVRVIKIGIDLETVMKNIPDTTNTMFWHNRYREYSVDELIELPQKKD